MDQLARYSGGIDQSVAYDVDGGGELGIRQLFEIIARQARNIALITLAIFALVLGATFFMTPQYFASASLKIDPNARALSDDTQRSTSPQAEQSRIDTETQILRSRVIAQKVVDRLGLEDDPELLKDAQDSADASSRKLAIDAFLERVSITRDSDDYIVDVGYSSGDPEKAARVANAIAETYLEYTIADRSQLAGEQAKWLTSRLQSLGSEVESTQAQVARYRAQSGIVQGESQGTITDQQVGPLSVQLAQAESEAAAANADMAAAKAQIRRGDITAVSGVLNSLVIAELRRQRALASAEKAEIETRYGAKHPENARATEQIRDLDAAIEAEANRIVAGLENKARAASARAASLRSALAQVRGEQAENTRAAVLAESLDREIKAKQSAYEDLARRLEQVSQIQRDLLPTAAIVERAVPPLHVSSPNRLLFGVLGLMLGLLVAFTAVLTYEFLGSTIRFSDDLSLASGLPLITTVPEVPASRRKIDGEVVSPERYVLEKPMTSFAEAFRTIRNSIVLSSDGKASIIAVLSALPSEGKSTVAVSLARTMALGDDRVLLIDCDLRRGRIGTLLGDDGPRENIVRVLKGEVGWKDAIETDRGSNLDILAAPPNTFETVDLFNGPAFHKMLEELRENYRFVVLDTPPTLAVADARAIASAVDTSIFVARSGATPKRAARIAIEFYRQDHSHLLGCVLTRAPVRGKRTARNDGSYYYNLYRSYVEA
ncbi:hypothetical protein B2G71_05170 [Novosphingobium sp. PC22D]|uniref:GumC family protein n=1 Tax=Novosphingobium sp. PC22D TaxID=1962403 RepID=UPI000BF090E6|nr:AAA family ATPase [Novosphingobium sp. PC22D]PEQ13712.1 hypothetical protein B2G71_05170 [Novosphingobium sp. PC22D]